LCTVGSTMSVSSNADSESGQTRRLNERTGSISPTDTSGHRWLGILPDGGRTHIIQVVRDAPQFAVAGAINILFIIRTQEWRKRRGLRQSEHQFLRARGADRLLRAGRDPRAVLRADAGEQPVEPGRLCATAAPPPPSRRVGDTRQHSIPWRHSIIRTGAQLAAPLSRPFADLSQMQMQMRDARGKMQHASCLLLSAHWLPADPTSDLPAAAAQQAPPDSHSTSAIRLTRKGFAEPRTSACVNLTGSATYAMI
jgi:hypothetical protein